jgi:hypothetical protein
VRIKDAMCLHQPACWRKLFVFMKSCIRESVPPADCEFVNGAPALRSVVNVFPID